MFALLLDEKLNGFKKLRRDTVSRNHMAAIASTSQHVKCWVRATKHFGEAPVADLHSEILKSFNHDFSYLALSVTMPYISCVSLASIYLKLRQMKGRAFA